MKELLKKVVCDNCGELIFRRNIRIENLSSYDRTSKEAYIRSLIELEDTGIEEATSWAEHGLYETCKEKTRFCPECNLKLRTWRAKQCSECNAQFTSWVTE